MTMTGCKNEEPNKAKSQEELNVEFIKDLANSGDVVVYNEMMGNIDDVLQIEDSSLQIGIGTLDFHYLLVVNEEMRILRNLRTHCYPISMEGAKVEFETVATSVFPYKFKELEVTGVSERSDLSEIGDIISDKSINGIGCFNDFGDGHFTFEIVRNTTGKSRILTVHLLTTIKTDMYPGPGAPQDFMEIQIPFIQYGE